MNISVQGTSDVPDPHSETGVFAAVIPSRRAIWLNLVERYTSRKFVLVVIVQVTAIVALFTRRMEPTTWLAVATLVLGTYFGATVADKRLNGGTG